MSIENIRNIKKLAQEKPPRTKLINRVSDKRKEEEKEYLKLREGFLKKHPVCEVPDCHKRSKDVHHMSGRNGTNYLDETTWLAVCRKCHTWITLNSKSAIVKGLSISRLTK